MNRATKEAASSNVQNLAKFAFIIVGFLIGYCASLLSAGKQMSSCLQKLGMVNMITGGSTRERWETIVSTMLSNSTFDEVYDEVYNNFNNILQDDGNLLHFKRTMFTLNDWKGVSGGGLHDSDRILLGKTYYDAYSVFEFGLGESTQIAAHVGVPRYSGVDSDAVWVEEARNKTNKANFRFFFADIGNTGAWGYPIDDVAPKIPLNYQFQALQGEIEPFDIYFVDGRYRVACVMASFLHAMSRKADITKTRVLIHDATRDAYQIVLQIAEIVDQSDFLYVLRLKQDVTEAQIASIWRNHKYVKGR